MVSPSMFEKEGKGGAMPRFIKTWNLEKNRERLLRTVEVLAALVLLDAAAAVALVVGVARRACKAEIQLLFPLHYSDFSILGAVRAKLIIRHLVHFLFLYLRLTGLFSPHVVVILVTGIEIEVLVVVLIGDVTVGTVSGIVLIP